MVQYRLDKSIDHLNFLGILRLAVVVAAILKETRN